MSPGHGSFDRVAGEVLRISHNEEASPQKKWERTISGDSRRLSGRRLIEIRHWLSDVLQGAGDLVMWTLQAPYPLSGMSWVLLLAVVVVIIGLMYAPTPILSPGAVALCVYGVLVSLACLDSDAPLLSKCLFYVPWSALNQNRRDKAAHVATATLKYLMGFTSKVSVPLEFQRPEGQLGTPQPFNGFDEVERFFPPDYLLQPEA